MAAVRLCTGCRCELPPTRKAWMCTACKRDYDRGRREGDPFDRSGDKPEWQCARIGCNNKATWRGPIRGASWRACDADKLPGDVPLD